MQLFHPMMPHLAEECWAALGHRSLLAVQGWPAVEPRLLVENTITLPVQVNGKKRADVTVARDAGNVDIEAAVLALDAVQTRARRQGAEEGHRRAAEDRQCGGMNALAPTLALAAWRSRSGAAALRRWRLWRLLPAALRRRVAHQRARRRRRAGGGRRRPDPAPNGTPLARIAVEVRNKLLFDLTGGGAGCATRLSPQGHDLASTELSVIVDINSGRPDVENYGLNASLHADQDIATGKAVVTGQTFARVSYDIPGQEQRFARARGLRDAENRAAKVIADNIRSRLASYLRRRHLSAPHDGRAQERRRRSDSSRGPIRRARSCWCSGPTPAWCTSAPRP